jgi:hypothetical protein
MHLVEDERLVYPPCHDTNSPPFCASGGGLEADGMTGPSTLSSTMTPVHLLSVQVLEDDRMVEGLDWYILPVLNPDGYQFTHEHVSVIH